MLERLAGHEYYCFLDGFSRYFHIPIAPEDQEKIIFTCPYGMFAYKRMPFGLCNAPTTTAIFHELIEDSMEAFMDDFSVFGSSFDHCLKNLEKMLKRRFIKDFSQIARPMAQLLVKDAPFNFSEECIQAFDTLKCELTQAPIMIKPDWSLPFEIMCDANDYAVRAVLGQRIDKHFKPIHYASKTMNEAHENYTTTEKELLAVVFAFDKLHAKPRLIRWILLLQEFDIEIHDKRGAENLAADHLLKVSLLSDQTFICDHLILAPECALLPDPLASGLCIVKFSLPSLVPQSGQYFFINSFLKSTQLHFLATGASLSLVFLLVLSAFAIVAASVPD
ncbi:reverse transcriptase domain-containing protein [Tanacetum coccineum]